MIDGKTTCWLKVEIKESKFVYSYDVGSSRGESTSPINPDYLCAFTELLKHCSSITNSRDEEFWRSIKAKAWIEKNKEKASEFISSLN